MKKKTKNILISIVLIALIICITIILEQTNPTVQTSSENISNKKIGWGIKRNSTHEQPDVGNTNKKLLEENNGICLGSNDKKYVYLTFDEGYEAGYTKQILDTLKENDVKAAFFLTAHYVNTEEELTKRMIEEGHIVGNHTPISLMSGNDIKVNARVIAYLEQIKTIKVFEKCMNEKLNISTYE